MWHFSTQGLPPSVITATGRELLPPVFTLICQRQTVIFCGTLCFRFHGTRLFTGAMLCAVRTFLVIKRDSSQRNANLTKKINPFVFAADCSLF